MLVTYTKWLGRVPSAPGPSPKRKGSELVDTAGWALASIGAIAAVFAIVRFVLDQIPGLSDSFVRAAASIRDARKAAQGGSATTTNVPHTRSDGGIALLPTDRPHQSTEGGAESDHHQSTLTEPT